MWKAINYDKVNVQGKRMLSLAETRGVGGGERHKTHVPPYFVTLLCIGSQKAWSNNISAMSAFHCFAQATTTGP